VGTVEANETLKDVLRREFKEENSLRVEVGNIRDGRIEETFDRRKIIVVFEIISAKGEICLNSEKPTAGLTKNHQIQFVTMADTCQRKNFSTAIEPSKKFLVKNHTNRKENRRSLLLN
jgi:ADP-ribose pyrophosphatase YjhB (NUDIX family)